MVLCFLRLFFLQRKDGIVDQVSKCVPIEHPNWHVFVVILFFAGLEQLLEHMASLTAFHAFFEALGF